MKLNNRLNLIFNNILEYIATTYNLWTNPKENILKVLNSNYSISPEFFFTINISIIFVYNYICYNTSSNISIEKIYIQNKFNVDLPVVGNVNIYNLLDFIAYYIGAVLLYFLLCKILKSFSPDILKIILYSSSIIIFANIMSFLITDTLLDIILKNYSKEVNEFIFKNLIMKSEIKNYNVMELLKLSPYDIETLMQQLEAGILISYYEKIFRTFISTTIYFSYFMVFISAGNKFCKYKLKVYAFLLIFVIMFVKIYSVKILYDFYLDKPYRISNDLGFSINNWNNILIEVKRNKESFPLKFIKESLRDKTLEEEYNERRKILKGNKSIEKQSDFYKSVNRYTKKSINTYMSLSQESILPYKFRYEMYQRMLLMKHLSFLSDESRILYDDRRLLEKIVYGKAEIINSYMKKILDSGHIDSGDLSVLNALKLLSDKEASQMYSYNQASYYSNIIMHALPTHMKEMHRNMYIGFCLVNIGP